MYLFPWRAGGLCIEAWHLYRDRKWEPGTRLKVDFLQGWAKCFQPSSQMFLYRLLAAMVCLRWSQNLAWFLYCKAWWNTGVVPFHDDKRGGSSAWHTILICQSPSKGKRGLSKSRRVHPIHARAWREKRRSEGWGKVDGEERFWVIESWCQMELEDRALPPPSTHMWPPEDCLAMRAALHQSAKSKMHNWRCKARNIMRNITWFTRLPGGFRDCNPVRRF